MDVVDIEPVFSLFRYFKQNLFGRPANNLKGIEALKLALGVGAPGQTSPDKGYSVRNFINMVPVLLNMLRPTGAAMAPAARENPLNAALQQAQEQLSAKSSELIEAQNMLEQLRGKLQDSLAAEAKLTDKVTYNTREQHALRVRVTDLTKTLNAANATLEQQHQLINDLQAQNQTLTAERDQLLGKLANLNTQLAALQSRLRAATQVLIQARSSASITGEGQDTARIQIEALRDALGRLEAELERQETGL